MKKLDFIDALRGYAILGVIMVHTSQIGQALKSDIGNSLAEQGARGVQLFYIASAFTLFYSYNQRKNDEQFQLRNFFIRRFFRIAPMFYFAIFYYLFQHLHSGRYFFDFSRLGDILSSLSFTLGFSPYCINRLVPGGWSIGVEAIFYLVLPILFKKINTFQKAFNLFFFSLILRSLLKYFLSTYPLISNIDIWNTYLFYYFPNQFPVFALGILLYFFIYDEWDVTIKSPKTILFFIFFGIFQISTSYEILMPPFIVFSFFLTCFVWLLSKYQPIWLVNSILIYIGKISFSIYLIHFAVFYWLNYYNILDFFKNTYVNYISKFIIITVVSIILSSFFYYFVELPFQKVGMRIIKRSKNISKS